VPDGTFMTGNAAHEEVVLATIWFSLKIGLALGLTSFLWLTVGLLNKTRINRPRHGQSPALRRLNVCHLLKV